MNCDLPAFFVVLGVAFALVGIGRLILFGASSRPSLPIHPDRADWSDL